MTASEYLKQYFGERPERKTEEKQGSYLDSYNVDSWARQHMEQEIVMDWNRVSKVREVEAVEAWDKSVLAQIARSHSKKHMKVLVECPNHGYYYKIMSDPPLKTDCWCDKCISDEMKKVTMARFFRDEEYKRKMKEK